MENGHDGWLASVPVNPATKEDRISVIAEPSGMNSDAVAGPWEKQTSPSANAPDLQQKTPLSLPADEGAPMPSEMRR